MDLAQLRILVVGAGIAGLALGRALHGHGCSVDIVERKARASDAGSGIYLPRNALAALRRLDLDAAVAARGTRIETQRFFDGRGRLLSEVRLDPVWGRTRQCIGILRADLHAALREVGDAVPVRIGVAVVALTDAEQAATVRLSDASEKETTS